MKDNNLVAFIYSQMMNIFILAVMISFLVFIFLNSNQPIKIQGDGVFYYSWLRSAVFDHDLDFHNELEYFAQQDFYSEKFVKENILTSNGKTPNPYAYGTAILWAPFFLVGDLLTVIFDFSRNGYSFFYVFMINFGTWLFGALALFLIFKSCLLVLHDKEKTDNEYTVLALLGVWLSTPFLYYQLLAPSMSHIPSLFLSSMLFYLSLKFFYLKDVNPWFFMLTIFLLCATRWQNILIVLVVAPLFVPAFTMKKEEISNSIKHFLIFILPLILFVVCQMLVWKNIYGKYLLIPQGHNFIRPEFHGLYVLFSSNRGLFSWSPFLLLVFFGMYYLWLKSRRVAIVVILAFIFTWIINGSLSDLGGGDAFGARRFLEILPFLIMPIVSLGEKFKKYHMVMFLIVGFFVLINLFLINSYRLGLIPRSGEFDLLKLITQ